MSSKDLISKDEKNRRKFPIQVKSVFPKRRQDVLNLNGWGFADSYFTFEGGLLKFKGSRLVFESRIVFVRFETKKFRRLV
jgi:hypothetical protein